MKRLPTARPRRAGGLPRARFWLVTLLASVMVVGASSSAAFATSGSPSPSSTPPATGSISGTVTDAVAPVAGATVVALDADGATATETTTTSSGGFTLAELAPGSYYVSVSASEHETRFWPNADSLATAETVTIASGEARTGADVVIPATAKTPVAAPTTAPSGAATGPSAVPQTESPEPSVAPTASASPTVSASPTASASPTVGASPSGAAPAASRLRVAAAPVTHSMSGRVVDTNGQPIAGVSVSAYGSTSGYGSAITASDGTYTISGLVGGKYTVSFYAYNTYVTQYYGGGDGSTPAVWITVSDADVTGIDATLVRYGTITGKTFGLDGEAVVARNGVRAINADTLKPTYSSSSSYDTNGYSLSLAPGTYYVYLPGGNVEAWADTFAPSTTTMADATRITVSEGQTVSGVDIHAQTGYSFHGRITTPVTRGTVVAYSADNRNYYMSSVESDGSYTIPHLANGQYRLQANGTSPSGASLQGYYGSAVLAGSPLVTINGADVTGIDFPLYGSGAIAGTISGAASDSMATLVTAYRWNGATWDQTLSISGHSAWGRYVLGSYLSGSGYPTFGLTEGTYTVSFTAPGDEAAYPYCPQWFDSAATQDAATRVTVTPQAVTDDIDAHLTLKSEGCGAHVIEPGTPTISGSPVVGSTLTVDPGTWAPEPVQLSYQWYANESPIAGATSALFTPTTAQQHATLTVAVTGSRPGYAPVTQTAAASGPVEPGQLTAGSVSIGGTLRVGSTLTAVTSGWDPSATLSYRWLANGATIDGATASTFVPTAAQVGAEIRVTVTATKDGYTPVSASTLPCTGDCPTVVGVLSSAVPTVSGTAQVGSTLTADAGSWAPAPVALAYQWLSGGTPIAGATAAAYTLTATDLGAAVSVRVTGTKDHYESAAVTSAATAPVVPGTLVTDTVSITGTPRQGETLTAVPGAWGPGSVTLAYQWKADGTDIAGATAATLVLGADQVGTSVSVAVTGTKAGYAAATVASGATAAVIGTLAAGTPTVAGSASVGVALTADPGTWGPAPVTLAYQWLLDGTPIAGATAATYTPTSDQAGSRISVRVTGSRSGYDDATRTSADVLVGGGTLVTAPVAIGGTAVQGQTLTATSPGWGPGAVELSYAWSANGAPIAGATGATLTLGADQVGAAITVTVTGTKTGYTSAQVTSGPAGPVIGLLATATPTITGDVRVGGTLTAASGTWGPGAVDLAYQWFVNGAAVEGATGTTFVIVPAQYGTTISVRVTGVKDGYLTASADSAATAAVRATETVVNVAGDLVAGSDIVVTGSGFAPFEEVRVELHSTPIVLGTVTTDATGAFTKTFRLPASVPAGLHHVVAYAAGGAPVEVPVQIQAVPRASGLPVTGGAAPWGALIAALVLLLGGAVAVGVGRLRRAR